MAKHKHSGNILICNDCDTEMCFSCASAIPETGEWLHAKCRDRRYQFAGIPATDGFESN